jgi:hypothetical protein
MLQPLTEPLCAPPPELLDRIRMEFIESPGLMLTEHQARRFWNLDAALCVAVLAALVGEKFLAQSRAGAYVRFN